MKFFFNKKFIIAIVTIICLIVMSFTIKPKENPNILERGFRFVFSPIQNTVLGVANNITGSVTFFGEMKGLKARNEELERENEVLEQKVRDLSNMEQENVTLREFLNLQNKYSNGQTVTCEIISKEPSIWFDRFVIDRGAASGIKSGMAVITPKGLVGKIESVTDNTATVISIIDVNNNVSARLTKTSDLVVAKGDSALKERGLMRLSYITSEVPISVGDVIETSGIGGIYPKGIFIGTVKEISKDNTSLEKSAVVETGVDFKRLEEVMVILGS